MNKIYSAQVFNYGKRVLFDLVIPEPAAFWIAAVISRRPEVSGLVKPPAWTLRPDELNIANYQDYVTIYDVPGVDPPPKRTLVVSKAYGSGAAGAESAGKQDNSQSDAGARFVVSDNLAIPDGYQAVWGRAQGAVSPGLLSQPIISKGSLPILFSGQLLALLGLGKFGWTVDAPENPKVVFEDLTGGFLLNGEEGVLPVSITASNVVSFQLNVEVECPRTDHAYQQWQLKTHAAITQAYLKLQGDYEDKLAQLAQQQDPQFAGGNPDMNRIIEQTELKNLASRSSPSKLLIGFTALRSPW